MSRDCCVALPRGAMGLSAVSDCGIFCSYSLTILRDFVFGLFLLCAVLSVLPSFAMISLSKIKLVIYYIVM